jgi:hypothetical protein
MIIKLFNKYEIKYEKNKLDVNKKIIYSSI